MVSFVGFFFCCSVWFNVVIWLWDDNGCDFYFGYVVFFIDIDFFCCGGREINDVVFYIWFVVFDVDN